MATGTTAADILTSQTSGASSSRFRYKETTVPTETGEKNKREVEGKQQSSDSGSGMVASSSRLPPVSTPSTSTHSLPGSSSTRADGLVVTALFTSNTSSLSNFNSHMNPLGVAPAHNKGKGKAIETESTLPDSEKYLMRSLSGPSDQKAGLGLGLIEGRSKEEVARIIYDTSKGSTYFLHEERKSIELTKKVEALLAILNARIAECGGENRLGREEGFVDEMIRELEKSRVVEEIIVVIDADAFFASCAERDDPALVGTAFAVGGGVLTTASYEARKYGCRSAMAGFVATKLCPHLKFVKMDFPSYVKASKEIMSVLAQYGEILPASLDEAYCSLTAYCAREKVTPAEAATRIRDQVKRETGLTVSAGVSSNFLLSKIAADFNKPNGQYVVPSTAEGAKAFMADLAIRKVPGIGRVSERWLRGLGVEKVGDIYPLRGKLWLVRKEIGLSGLLRAYLGLGSTKIVQPLRGDRKGVGQEETFSPTNDYETIIERLKKISEDLAYALASKQYSGRTINLVCKYDTYERVTRAKTPGSNLFYSDAPTLYRIAKELLDKIISERRIAFDQKRTVKGCGGKREIRLRLIGIRMSNLRDDKALSGNKSGTGDLSSWTEEKPSSQLTKREKKLRERRELATMMGYEEDEAGEDLTGEVDLDASDSEDEELENMEDVEGKVNLGDQGDGDKVEAKKEDETRTMRRECPVCQKILTASLVGLNHHVMGHFDNDEKKSKKRPQTVVESVSKGKTKAGDSSKKVKMVESSRAGFFSKRKT